MLVGQPVLDTITIQPKGATKPTETDRQRQTDRQTEIDKQTV